MSALRWISALGLLAMTTLALAAGETQLDDFDDLRSWSAISSETTTVLLNSQEDGDGSVMRVDFDIPSDGGYVILRRELDLELPDNYAFSFKLRGEAPRNDFEFKLVDPSGKNVWWRKQRDFAFPTAWQPVVIRKARIVPAWGVRASPKRIGAIEIAISAGNAGKGTIWIDDLRFEERETAGQYRRTAKVTASSALAEHEPELVIDDDRESSWASTPEPEKQTLTIDFVRQRDYGGLIIDWDPLDYATSYRVQVSDDGEHWTTSFVNSSAKGGRDYVYMPDAESRFVRLSLLESSRKRGYGVRGVTIQPLEFSDTPNQFFEALAAEAAPGTYPKYFYGKQTYWTVVGVDGDDKNALFNEEGLLEVEKGGFSIEPFVYAGGKLLDWSSAPTRPSLEEGYLPIPTVSWETQPVALHTTAFAAGAPGDSTLYAIYAVENRSPEPQKGSLFLTIRPFQVNPPWQSLNMVGGVAPIHEIRFDAGMAWVNRDKPVVALDRPTRVGASSFARGAIVDALRDGRVPTANAAADRFGFATAAMEHKFDLAPGARQEFAVAVPFHPGDSFAPPGEDSPRVARARLEETRRYWKKRLNHVVFDLPLDGGPMARTVQSTLAYILINRAGPRLQPGPRNYARSWIRDGALTSAALLQNGFHQEPRDFMEWFAPYQQPDGKIPCCVDRRGPDPVPEHDSHGQFIYAIGEIYRYTRDVGFVAEMWPHVVKTVEYLDRLRRSRRTDEYRSGDKRAYFGLLPASISHEGYASKAVHAYWDDFFALRGFKDAAMLAVAVGDDENIERFAKIRDEFRTDLLASVERTIAMHGIDFVPGSVELGDFDPSATASAIDPGGEMASLPEKELRHTFERYIAIVRGRRTGTEEWDAFTPYELRNAAALVRLGMRSEALEVIRDMLAAQRPPGWNLWQEILWRDADAPSFIGDMPHTWVASALVRAVRTLFVYERDTDQALVIAAGVPREWVVDGRHVAIQRLPTHHGVLHYRLESDGPNRLRLELSGDLRLPPGGIVVRPPLERPLRAVTVDGQPLDAGFTAEEATIRKLPATVVLESEGAAATTEGLPLTRPSADLSPKGEVPPGERPARSDG